MKLTTDTQQGPVRGRERRGVALFAGIPYATPPIGDLRWRPPQPLLERRGIFDATTFGKFAPQLPGNGLTNSSPVDWSEDCLTLNVMTPDIEGASRPVMVWIHGGAFNHGSGAVPWYDGTSFATSGDVVVVTINYRLGAFGFGAVGEGSGVNGLVDQVAALEWVRANIASFGGDPGQVTIAGESAGAMSVSTVLAMPRADGLYKRAIAQSGATHHTADSEEAERIAYLLLRELDVSSITSARRLPALAVLEAQQRVEKSALGHESEMAFRPSPDGAELPGQPLELMRLGASSGIELLTGTNADEATLWGTSRITDDRLHRAMARFVDPPDDLIDHYRERWSDASSGEIATSLATDQMFRIPAIRMAEARAVHGGATWMYLFDWKSKAFGGALGATHALDIPFTFNNLGAPGVEVFLGTDQLPHVLAREIHESWTAFIRTGSPVTSTFSDWPRYSPDDRCVMELSERPRILHDPEAELRRAWSGWR
ncbi:MAG: carboxylesterase/lipase family protein [Acidimicrobiales bacterium]